MAIGKFNETSENKDNRESKIENSEKNKEQKVESNEKRGENVDRMIANHAERKVGRKEQKDSGEQNGDKPGLWDRFKSFGKKENSDGQKEKSDASKETSPRQSFKDRLKEGAPSMDKQATDAKKLEGRDEYLKNREMSDRANKENPNKKSWELSSEQREHVNKGTKEVLDKYNKQN